MSSDEHVISARRLGKSYTIDRCPAHPLHRREAIARRIRDPLDRGGRHKASFWALRDVDLDVRRGEVVGIIGKWGGQEQLLKILSRITRPTTGTVDIRGRVASLLEVGTGFHPELTGRENIFLNGCILGMTRREIRRKFDEIVAFAEVETFLDTPVKRYSSGMAVRLAFAVAAHLESDILIVDEVLAVGDIAFQRECVGKMSDVTRHRGSTILLVSHSLATVRSLCNRVVWMKSGGIIRDGEVGGAIEGYLTEDLGGAFNTFEIGSMDRPHIPEPPLRLTGVTFNEGAPIRHGEPLQIDVEFRAERRIRGAVIVLAFSNLEGGPRHGGAQRHRDRRRIDAESGTAGRAALLVAECHLQPDRYLLDAGAVSGENAILDVLKSFAQVEVVPGGRTPARLIGRVGAGCVVTPVEWKRN